MADVMWKLKVLVGLLRATFEDWRREVWRRDPDRPYCCPGRMQDECGCMGATVRMVYDHQSTPVSRRDSRE